MAPSNAVNGMNMCCFASSLLITSAQLNEQETSVGRLFRNVTNLSPTTQLAQIACSVNGSSSSLDHTLIVVCVGCPRNNGT
jgi:hypothetical protein